MKNIPNYLTYLRILLIPIVIGLLFIPESWGPLNVQLPVSQLAKWKTTIQMIALGFLVMGDYGDVVLPHTLEIGQWGLTMAAILTVITGWDYLKAGFKHFPK